MTGLIDTFYALDFDRSLGNFEACLDLLAKTVEKHTDIKSEILLAEYEKIKQAGGQLQVIDYIEKNASKEHMVQIKKAYLDYARLSPGSLLEPCASDFIDHLSEAGHTFCIVTFGEHRWQTMKLEAAGLGHIPALIVSDERKGLHIASWFDETKKCFCMPNECFKGGDSKMAREVVLIDDKPNAFFGFPKNARGYLLQDINRMYASKQGKVPSNVRRVNRLDEVIFHEQTRTVV